MAQSRIAELAAIIQGKTQDVDQYLHTHNLPQPTFDEDGPVNTSIASAAIEQSRMQVADAALELHDLLVGPMELVRPVLNATSLQFIYKFNIPSKVPPHSTISYASLAAQLSQPEHVVRRILRFAISYHRIFTEPIEGHISHSAASRYLRDDPAAFDGLGVMFDDAYQAFAHTVDALTEPRAAGQARRTGWSVAHGTEMPLFAYAGLHPDKGRRFGGAMASFSTRPTLDVRLLVDGYDWGALEPGATVVDVGGADGYTSIALARRFPGLKLVVQDTAGSIERFADKVPEDVRDRVRFEAHDFFEPQKGQADVYLLRQILHNWSDEDCVRILKALGPGLKKGGRVLINDHLVEAPGKAPLHLERRMRDMDLIMLSLFDQRDCEAEDWRRLFRTADSRYGEVNISQPAASQLAVVESVWSG